jgi:HAMP domain-containing protein
MSSRGVLELSSSVHIKSTGWLMQSVLPAEEAFAPIRTLQRQLFGLALLLTLLAGGLSWWWLRRQLLPLSEATQLLTRMGDGELPKQALPVSRDEVGLLATSFNGLLERIQREEDKAPNTPPTSCCARSCRRFPAWCSSTGCLPMATVAFPLPAKRFTTSTASGLKQSATVPTHPRTGSPRGPRQLF